MQALMEIIESQKQTHDALIKRCKGLEEAFDELYEENKRLREALKRIIAESTYGGLWTVADCADVANEALKGDRL
jgi:hypothetical protein